MTQGPPPRRRDRQATREAILQSAVAAFTAAGYDGVGVREIAAKAGVTAMLVGHYFGSKEGLFEQVVDRVFSEPRVILDRPAWPDAAARNLVTRTDPDGEQIDPFLLMLRSASNPRAVEIMRAATARHAGARLGSLLDGPGADERTALVLSVIAGVWMMRRVVGLPALTDADPEDLARHVLGLFAALSSEDSGE